MDFLRGCGFDLKTSKTRGFTKLYNVNTKKSLTFDLTAPKTEVKTGVWVDELTLYLCDLVEHQKIYNIAQFDKWNYGAYKNPYELHD